MEQWKEFDSEEIINDDYEVYEICRNEHGTIIKLTGLENELHLRFDFVDSLRFTDEGRRIVTYHEVKALQNYRTNFNGNPLFIVKDSEYINWLNIESAGFIGEVEHFAIVTRNDIVDIVASTPPRIVYVYE
ncbi:hypothetical protein GIX45_05055 [Erwinia sp. CPCC 100877]|nr:hypothetical protein [Erwinia sp. CPCC 100877]